MTDTPGMAPSEGRFFSAPAVDFFGNGAAPSTEVAPGSESGGTASLRVDTGGGGTVEGGIWVEGKTNSVCLALDCLNAARDPSSGDLSTIFCMGRCGREDSKFCWKRKEECFVKGHRSPKAQLGRPVRIDPEGRYVFLQAKSSRGDLFAYTTPHIALSQIAVLNGWGIVPAMAYGVVFFKVTYK